MQRDLNKIRERDFDNVQKDDIIYRKYKLQRIFENDADIVEVLGRRTPRPLNRYEDEKNPTPDEIKTRQEIEQYNQLIRHQQIVPYLKLNGIQKEILNFLMFEVEDSNVSYNNRVIKIQTVLVMCLVHEDDMDTEYGIVRTDLLSYLVKDLLSWSNVMGKQLKCTNDFSDIIDTRYYCRTLKFQTEAPNGLLYTVGGNNRYDRFRI